MSRSGPKGFCERQCRFWSMAKLRWFNVSFEPAFTSFSILTVETLCLYLWCGLEFLWWQHRAQIQGNSSKARPRKLHCLLSCFKIFPLKLSGNRVYNCCQLRKLFRGRQGCILNKLSIICVYMHANVHGRWGERRAIWQWVTNGSTAQGN